MSLDPRQLDRLHELLGEVRDDRLSDVDRHELESLVLADPRARQLFVGTMHVFASLRWVNCDEALPVQPAMPGAKLSRAVRTGQAGVRSGQGSVRSGQAGATSSDVRSPILGFLADLTAVTFVSRSLFFWFVAIVTNAVLVFALALAVSPNLRARVADNFGPPINTDMAQAVMRGPVVARLVEADGCQWQGGKIPTVGAPLTPGKLQLKAGVAQVEFGDGARVLFSGPSDFEILDASHVHLQVGRLRANVPHQAIGFAVLTPTAEVIDLGTEFGVTSSDAEGTEVQVYRGQVAVQPVVAETPAQATRTILRAGEFKRIGRSVATGDLASKQQSPAPGAVFDVADLQPGARSDDLVAYWNFEDDRSIMSDRRVRGLVGQGAAGFDSAGALVWKRSLPLSDRLTVEAVLVSHWSGKRGDTDYILRHCKHDTTSLLLALENDAQTAGPALVFAVATDEGPRSIAMSLDGKGGRPALAELTNGRPHHLAVTFQRASAAGPGQMAIFVDGRQRIQRAIDARRAAASEAGSPGLKTSGDPRDSFSGVLDEVAVYRTALSPEQIAQHWQAVVAGRGYFVRTADLRVPFPNDDIRVLNADFETIYKPGTNDRVSGTLAKEVLTFTIGFGDDSRLACGTIRWSDGTLGGENEALKIPGWTASSAHCGLGLFASARTGRYGAYVNGPKLGGPPVGVFLSSSEPLGVIQPGRNYQLTADVWAGAGESGPLDLNLLANGQELTPTERHVPADFTTGWQKVSLSYSAASLAAQAGRSLTVKLGIGPDATGKQLEFDNVQITSEPAEQDSESLLLGANTLPEDRHWTTCFASTLRAASQLTFANLP